MNHSDTIGTTMNDTPTIGHNQSPFALAMEAVDTVYTEARNWLDGEPITTQAQADEVTRLKDMALKAWKSTDASRKCEAKPFDEGKAEVQKLYKPLLERADGIKSGCLKLLATFLATKEEERLAELRAARAAESAALRAVADAARAAEQTTALAAQEAAQEAAVALQEASADARLVATTKVGGKGEGRRVTLRSVWSGTITDGTAAAWHYWETDREAILAAVQNLVDASVRAGVREIPGVTITEEKVAR